MRIFIAISCNKRIEKEYKKLKKSCDLKVGWENSHDLHVTLIPPWNSHDIKSEIEKLKVVKGVVKPFSIVFNRLELGPNPNKTRVIWAKGEANPSILHLHKSLEKVFGKTEERAFIPHITLARFKDTQLINFDAKDIYWTQEIKSIVLMGSLGEKIDRKYKILSEIKL